MEQSIVPLMIGFKSHADPREPDFQYDEAAQLNVSLVAGQLQPAVLVPGSLANIKTVRESAPGGED
jgi:hypothetical protein